MSEQDDHALRSTPKLKNIYALGQIQEFQMSSIYKVGARIKIFNGKRLLSSLATKISSSGYK